MALSVVTSHTALTILKDTVANVQSKTFDFTTDIRPLVGGASCVEIPYIFVVYAANAVAGTREIAIDILDAADGIVFRIASAHAHLVNTTVGYAFSMGLFTSARDLTGVYLLRHEELPQNFRLVAGLKIRVSAPVAADAGDDMDVYLHMNVVTGPV
jgi:hypothetical protein